LSDYDQDGDGEDDYAYGGLDCDDTDATTVGDDDGDGYYSCVNDCDDDDSTSNPAGTEICGDGIDQDCSGSDQSCNTITWNGYVYASIDGHPVQDSGIGCQSGLVSLLSGWEVAPYVAGIESWLYNNTRFGTHVMVLSNGCGYGTRNFSYGQWSNCSLLSSSGNSYGVNNCSLRVLIRRPE
jgi:hypothetical protein